MEKDFCFFGTRVPKGGLNVKIGKVSCTPLVLGLIVSLLALWIGAAPVLGGGSSTTGGVWYEVFHGLTGRYLGCTARVWDCQHCIGTQYQDCSENQDFNCTTGYIIVAIASTSTTVLPAASATYARCSDCPWYRHAICWMP
jgi:hypothetical protein